MSQQDKYIFKIEAYTPKTFPMSRLAEYLAQFAALLGNTDRVHFEKLDEGSTKIVTAIEREALPKVESRLALLKSDDPPEDAKKAEKAINKMLQDDNAVAEIIKGTAQIIRFPGHEIPKPERIGPFTQHTEIEGVLIRIGGRDITAHAQIQDVEGRIWNCIVTRDQARHMAQHLFGAPLRIFGEGRWERDESEQWQLMKFTVKDFGTLDDRNLQEAIEELRKIEESKWSNENDPIALLENIRKGPDEVH